VELPQLDLGTPVEKTFIADLRTTTLPTTAVQTTTLQTTTVQHKMTSFQTKRPKNQNDTTQPVTIGHSICTPSRASLMSGRFASHTGMQHSYVCSSGRRVHFCVDLGFIFARILGLLFFRGAVPMGAGDQPPRGRSSVHQRALLGSQEGALEHRCFFAKKAAPRFQ
jgi:hypothetical protein